MTEPTMPEIYATAAKVLTQREFEAWTYRVVLEWSFGDIAAAVGSDRSTVSRRVRRANAKVNAALEEAA